VAARREPGLQRIKEKIKELAASSREAGRRTYLRSDKKSVGCKHRADPLKTSANADHNGK
jgi:hypothetical protein